VRIKDQSIKFDISVYQWTTVVELKQIIQKTTGAVIASQRLFYRQNEMSNVKCLNDYGVFDSKAKERVIELDHKQHSSQAFLHVCPGVSTANSRALKLISELHQAFINGLAPNLTIDGTGGTYLLRDSGRKVAGVFKPLDEEPFAPFNPRGHTGNMGSKTFRNGVLSGEACYREVAAFELDKDHFSSVPFTTLAEAQHPNFCYGEGLGTRLRGKIGSLQRYEKNDGMAEDYSPTMFHRQEVQKIAVLDMRILNMDRNEGNILVVKSSKKLIPIDHGMSLPDCLDVCVYDLCWMAWPHVRDPCTEETKTYVAQIDPLKDVYKLKDKFPIRDACLRTFRTTSLLLVRGVEAGLSLYDIGQIMYRLGYGDTPSMLEKLLEKAAKLYEAIKKNLSHQLKAEYSLLTKDLRITAISMGRTRAYSENELELVNSFIKPPAQVTAEHEAQASESEYSESSLEGLNVIREEEEEKSDDEALPRCKLRRISSLPELKEPASTRKSEDSAFDNELFYYIDMFIQQTLLKQAKRGLTEESTDVRSRSLSNIVEFREDI
jgi:hypothetical protein